MHGYIILFVLSVTLSIHLKAQLGFHETYDIGEYSSQAHSVVVKHDTVTICGTSWNQDSARYNVFLLQIDTNGQIIRQKIHFDPNGKSFNPSTTFPMLSLSDGSGFLLAGRYFGRASMVAKFNNELEMCWLREYNYTFTSWSRYVKLEETSDGYLVAGAVFHTAQGRENGILKMINKEDGAVKWWRHLQSGDPKRWVGVGSIDVKSDNEIICAGYRNLSLGTPEPYQNFQQWIFAVDSLGNTKWQWIGEPTQEESGIAGDVLRLPNGRFGYFAYDREYVSPPNVWYKRSKLMVRDSNFELVLEEPYGLIDFNRTVVGGVRMKHYVGLMGVGLDRLMVEDDFGLAGVLVRPGLFGESTWMRFDTAYWDNDQVSNDWHRWSSENIFVGAADLPSGSIIAVGYSTEYTPQEHRRAWVIKVSKDGCLDTLFCGALVDTEEAPLPEEGIQLQAYPNPSAGPVRFRYQLPPAYRRVLLRIVDVNGRELWQQAVPGTEGELEWPAAVPPGLYFYQLLAEGRPLRAGKVVRR